ncbi:activator of HSP90 ATPase [Paenibacillus albilobatus]|uniref:Activator of HSP90 ATPase n=1 Tax=Paenibacillus albilobatus TaxID=2716884 RepID=A0A919XLB9_9BACL|nr:activator of HSP90 ATPase [Paenibacillus albilobatus]
MVSKHFATHDTFVIERNYEAAPARAFAAWSDPAIKSQWFQKSETFEFLVGGREFNRGGPPGGPVFTFDACFQEIVPDERIIYSYSLDQEETRISVSVVTVEFKQAEHGTRLIYTEQCVFLDGYDTVAQREHGTKIMLDKLGEVLLHTYDLGASNEEGR